MKKKNNKKPKVLFVLKSSKTKTTGFYVMNEYVRNSDLIKEKTQLSYLVFNSSDAKNRFLFSIQTIINTIVYSFVLIFKIISFKPKLVYFTISPVNSFLRDLVYISILKLFKQEIIYHIHGKGIKTKYSSNKFYRFLYNWAYRDVHVICLSKKLIYDFEYLPIKKHWIVPNAIPKLDKKLLVNDFFEQENRFKITFLSNLIISKGILDYISALKLLFNTRNDFVGFIVGKESEMSSSDLQKELHGYNNFIKYIGPLYGKEKDLFLASSNLFVFPTYYPIETWGVVILEAMRAGLPVIATNEGAITDMVVNGVNGFIVEKNNPKQIAEKIEYLIDHPKLMKKMGQKGKQKFEEEFTLEVFEQNMVRVLNQMAENDRA